MRMKYNNKRVYKGLIIQVKTILRDTLMIIVLAGVLFVGLQFAVQRYAVDGPSMQVSFHNGQQLLVNKAVYYFHEPERGDVIIFNSCTTLKSNS